jgi:hypothetical protein
MRNLLLVTSLLVSACSLSSLAIALDVGGAVGGAAGAAGRAAGGVAGAAGQAAGGAVGTVGSAAGSTVGAFGGAANSAAGAVGSVARGTGAVVGSIAGTVSGATSGTIGAVGGTIGAGTRAVGSTVGSTAPSTGGLFGSFGAASTATRSLAAPSDGPASTAPRAAIPFRSWMLSPPRKVYTLVYFPLESLYRRKPRQIRRLLARLDRETFRAVRTSCRQVLAAPRSFTYERVQVCKIARSL